MPSSNEMPVQKKQLSRMDKLLRLLKSALDPRAYAHVFKLINYYNYMHVTPLRQIEIGPGAAISPNSSFANPERIKIGARFSLGAYSSLWAGPGQGRIIIGDDVLFGPDVMVTAANYRFNDGTPVTKQAMDEADITIGNDVWIGAKAMILPGAVIGDGAIIGGGAIVMGEIPAFAIALGVLFLNESLSLQQSIGLMIIVSGLVVIDGRVFRWVKR